MGGGSGGGAYDGQGPTPEQTRQWTAEYLEQRDAYNAAKASKPNVLGSHPFLVMASTVLAGITGCTMIIDRYENGGARKAETQAIEALQAVGPLKDRSQADGQQIIDYVENACSQAGWNCVPVKWDPSTGVLGVSVTTEMLTENLRQAMDQTTKINGMRRKEVLTDLTDELGRFKAPNAPATAGVK